jgi:hypothetical protein
MLVDAAVMDPSGPWSSGLPMPISGLGAREEVYGAATIVSDN